MEARAIIGLGIHELRADNGKIAEARIQAIMEYDIAARLRSHPHNSGVLGHVAGDVTE
jgi:hypothetical protein